MKKHFVKIFTISILSLSCIIAYYRINYYILDHKELISLKKLLNEVHYSIKYGNPGKQLFFKNEILKNKTGHCGNLSRLLIFDLLKIGYNNFDIISISTYNKRNHTLVQLNLKNSAKAILLDPTTNIIYMHSLGQLLDKPSLCNDITGKSSFPKYSDINFWSTIENIIFIPYLDGLVIKPDMAYLKKNNIYLKSKYILNNLFDGIYRTYINIKIKQNKSVNIIAEFNKKKRISSIVIYPYDTRHYPSHLSIYCKNRSTEKKLFDGNIHITRGMIIVNLYKGPYCNNMEFSFSNCTSNTLLLRNIFIYGE